MYTPKQKFIRGWPVFLGVQYTVLRDFKSSVWYNVISLQNWAFQRYRIYLLCKVWYFPRISGESLGITDFYFQLLIYMYHYPPWPSLIITWLECQKHLPRPVLKSLDWLSSL